MLPESHSTWKAPESVQPHKKSAFALYFVSRASSVTYIFFFNIHLLNFLLTKRSKNWRFFFCTFYCSFLPRFPEKYVTRFFFFGNKKFLGSFERQIFSNFFSPETNYCNFSQLFIYFCFFFRILELLRHGDGTIAASLHEWILAGTSVEQRRGVSVFFIYFSCIYK